MKKALIILLSLYLTSNLLGQSKKLKINHFYIVVDSLVFQNLNESEVLDSLVNLDKGLPEFEPLDSLSTTIYLRGEKTYVEIMGLNNKFNKKVGSIGIGFCWDSESVLDTIFKQKIRAESKLTFHKYEAKWKYRGNKGVSWYTAYYTSLKGNIATWYAIYHPVFLTHINQEEYTSFKREYYLSKPFNQDKAVTDVLKIELDCNQEDYSKIIRELDCFYIDSNKININETVFSMDGIEVKMNLIEDNQSRIKNFILKMKEPLKVNLNLGSLLVKSVEDELVFEFSENQ